MDSSIVSGLIGGLAAIIIGTIVTKTSRKKLTNGELKHGVFIFIVAILCLALSLFAVWAFFYDKDVHEKTSEFVAVVGLFFGFGLGAFVCFAEFFKVKGRFDEAGISFYTPWTGAKDERWDNLISAEFNALMYWYTLEFKSGKRIRLSAYLMGHGAVLDLLKQRGYNF